MPTRFRRWFGPHVAPCAALLATAAIAGAQSTLPTTVDSEDQLRQITEVLKVTVPPDQVYSRLLSVENALSNSQRWIESSKTQTQGLDQALNEVQGQITGLQAAATQCGQDFKLKLTQLEHKLDNDYYGVEKANGNDFSLFMNTLRKLKTMTDTSVCADLRNPTGTLSVEIRQTYSDGISHAKEKLEQRKSLTNQLIQQYQQSTQELSKQNERIASQSNTTNSVERSLPWIVVALCIFGLLILVILRFLELPIQADLVRSGQLIQFPMVMVLLVTVVILGLTHILHENSLSALLGGLAGYVLSQGVGTLASQRALNDRNLNNLKQSAPTEET